MKLFFKTITLFSLLSLSIHAEELTKEQSSALVAKIELVKKWAAEAALVSSVKKVNAEGQADFKDITQDKWKELPVLDPKVRSLTKNESAETIKKLKDDSVSEAFLSAADGTKVAFLSKTSNWSHKGKAKHDDPMSNKSWTGKVETDESTGSLNIQVAVPVLDGGKPIGSLCVGFAVAKLK
jgi:hypothetical protein